MQFVLRHGSQHYRASVNSRKRTEEPCLNLEEVKKEIDYCGGLLGLTLELPAPYDFDLKPQVVLRTYEDIQEIAALRQILKLLGHKRETKTAIVVYNSYAVCLSAKRRLGPAILFNSHRCNEQGLPSPTGTAAMVT